MATPFERFAAVPPAAPNPVFELRVALTLEDYEQAVAFYRDALGLTVRMAWDDPEIGAIVTRRWGIEVKSRPGSVPRMASQASRAATGAVVAC